MPHQGNNVRNIVADRRSVVVGRDVMLGEGSRVALGDYHEHNSDIRENEPEWGRPPYGSGLILCLGCRRRHIAQQAIACSRCGYPQREIVERRANKVRARLKKEAALRNLCAAACATPILWHGVMHHTGVLSNFIGAALSGAAGYVILPAL